MKHLLKSIDKMCKYKMDLANTEWTRFGLHTDVQMDRWYTNNTLLLEGKINHTESYTLGNTAATQYFPPINADENWTQAADQVMGKFCQCYMIRVPGHVVWPGPTQPVEIGSLLLTWFNFNPRMDK